ncbi:hypothetical protein [Pectobacterium zantedeschiae]|nr:hypothetical protein [Pectobacterium zantedeschiae]
MVFDEEIQRSTQQGMKDDARKIVGNVLPTVMDKGSVQQVTQLENRELE